MSSIKITFRELIRQAVSDWFGKEVQTGYTYTYIWMANQFGHFNLGFLFTYLVYFIILFFCSEEVFHRWMLWVPLIQLFVWITKETYDYFKAVGDARRQGIFPIDRSDIAWNAATAVLYISFGLITSYLSMVNYGLGVLSFVVVFLIGIPPAWYWMVRKMYFQSAGLPFQFRLSDFSIPLQSTIDPTHSEPSELLTEKTIRFIEDENGEWKHILIFGARKSGKTSFAAGIGTEKAFIKGIVNYSSYFKFLQTITELSPIYNGYQASWNWDYADLLIIDDINPNIDDIALTSPEVFEKAFLDIPENCKTELLKRKTVWLLGLLTDDNDSVVNNWVNKYEILLNTPKEKIGVLILK